ncbi:hypothetical protein N7540_002890 [Penicillium herquei]|nr:hypothetical protein N7540_002890 [Penicillium herquei]
MAVLSVMASDNLEDERIYPQGMEPPDWMSSLPADLLDKWGVALPDPPEGYFDRQTLVVGSDGVASLFDNDSVYTVLRTFWDHEMEDGDWDKGTEDILNISLKKLEEDLESPPIELVAGVNVTNSYADLLALLATISGRLKKRVDQLEAIDDPSPRIKAELIKIKRLLDQSVELYEEKMSGSQQRLSATLRILRSLQSSSPPPPSSCSSPNSPSPPQYPAPSTSTIIHLDEPSSSAVTSAPGRPVNELNSNSPSRTVSALPQSSNSTEAAVVLTPTTTSPPLSSVTSFPRKTEPPTISEQWTSLSTVPEVAEDMASPLPSTAAAPAMGTKSKKKKGKKAKGKKQSSQTPSLSTSTLEPALPEKSATKDAATQTDKLVWFSAAHHLESASQAEPPVGSPILPANSAGTNKAGSPSLQTAKMTVQAAEPPSPTSSAASEDQPLWNPWWNLHFHSRTHLFWQRQDGRLEATELSALTRANNDSPCRFLPDCQQHQGNKLCWCPECKKGLTPRWCCCAHYPDYCILSSRSQQHDVMVLQYPDTHDLATSSQHYVSRFTCPGLVQSTSAAEVTTAGAATAKATPAKVTSAKVTSAKVTSAKVTPAKVTSTEATTAGATAGDTANKPSASNLSRRKKVNKNKRSQKKKCNERKKGQASTSPTEPELEPELEPEPALPSPSQELCPQPSGAAEVTSDPPSESVVAPWSLSIPQPASRLRRVSWPLSLLSIEEVYPVS